MQAPKSPSVNRNLPHQIRLGVTSGDMLTVSCNCLPAGTYFARKRRFREHEALDIYRGHLESPEIAAALS